MLADAGAQTGHIPKESGEADSSCTEAETLLRALRNVILPLIRTTNGEDGCDANQTSLGLGGKEFIVALEKFMCFFLRSQRSPVGGIEVELEEKGADVLSVESQATSHYDLSPQDVSDAALDAEPLSDRAEENTIREGLESMNVQTKESPDGSMVSMKGLTNISDTAIFEQRKSRFIEKALNKLREYVFNTMPIRLLCFKQEAVELQITLIERSEIYAHIASNLNGIDFLTVSQEIASFDTPSERYSGFTSERAELTAMERLIKKYSRYAILSHTWIRGEFREVTYGDWIRREFDTQQPGYRKLVNFCRTAWKDYGVVFGWMDTICINKESSAELDESIRSMYKWYTGAHVCITYLAETKVLLDMHNDTWFTRGWTLQEFFAPSHIKFYNAYWKKLVGSDQNDKQDPGILKQIKEAMSITTEELQQIVQFIPISRRMQMAAKRQVTREEDSAYSLMGIFDVSIATAYGEGADRAFSRLLQEVLNSSSYSVADLFNWASSDRSRISSLLPSSIQGYLHRSSSLDTWVKPIEPVMLTHLGLRITTLLMPVISIQNPIESQYDPFGHYHAIANIFIHPIYLRSSEDAKIANGSYSVLDARISDRDGWNEEKNWFQWTLGVLNIGKRGR